MEHAGHHPAALAASGQHWLGQHLAQLQLGLTPRLAVCQVRQAGCAVLHLAEELAPI